MLPRTLGVVGAGQMGCGIAQCAAMAGFDVLLYDASFSAVQKATGSVRAALQRLADKHKITLQDAELAQHRIKFADKMEVCKAQSWWLCNADEQAVLLPHLDLQLSHVGLVRQPHRLHCGGGN